MMKIDLSQVYCYDTVTRQRVRIMREAYQGFYILIGNKHVYRPLFKLQSLY